MPNDFPGFFSNQALIIFTESKLSLQLPVRAFLPPLCAFLPVLLQSTNAMAAKRARKMKSFILYDSYD